MNHDESRQRVGLAASAPLRVRLVLALGCMCTVAPLLAWVEGLGAFTTWFVAFSLPVLTAVTITLVWWSRSGRFPDTVTAARAGVIGGLLGTLGYDLVRIPVVAFGYQVLAPIDSYGVLLLSAPASSPVTGFAGWAFHFENGVFFALAFALVASRRPLWWAIVFALVLESGAVFSGFADYYQLSGQWGLIAVAYLAHVPYGLAVGWMTGSPERRMEPWTRSLVAPVTVCLASLALVLVLWHRPFAIAESSTIDVRSGVFHPRWARISVGDCLEVTNHDGTQVRLTGGGPVIAAGATARFCPAGEGIRRTKVSGRPRSGGFVILDPAG